MSRSQKAFEEHDRILARGDGDMVVAATIAKLEKDREDLITALDEVICLCREAMQAGFWDTDVELQEYRDLLKRMK